MRCHPQLGVVAKRQFFDIQQAVGAVTVGQVGGDGGVVDRQAAVGVAGKVVVTVDVAVERNVGFAIVTVIKDLTHDVQLARVDHAVQHVGIEFFHAVDTFDDATLCVAHFDTYVQPGIAIDDVIPRFTHDAVAAAAAENNVRAVVRVQHHTIHGAVDQIAADHLIQAVDACHPVEGEVVGEWRSLNRGGAKRLIGPGEHIIKFPARQPLHQVEAIPQDKLLLVNEDRNAEVRVGADNVALMDRPVEARHPVVTLDARPLHHDVIARFAVVVSVVPLTVQHVVTDNGTVEEQLGVFARQGVKAVAALKPVVAFVAQ